MLIVLAVQSFGADVPVFAANADTGVLAAVAASMFAIALGASWLPAIRARRIAPASALRAE
jgi:ABC-type lipoprotein release transport system permease subunit